MTSPELHAYSVTDVGRVRDHNEDSASVFIPSDPSLLERRGVLSVVADGMGGFEAGEIASSAAVDTFSHVYYDSLENNPAHAMILAARAANAEVRKIPAKRCGTTLVAAAVIGSRLIILNIGDSRAYKVTPDGRAAQLTADHSWVADQVQAGLMSQSQADSHARKNVLTRALGASEYPDVDVTEETLAVGESVVLCSDGLHNLVSTEEIGKTVSECAPNCAAMKLVALANERGGNDNISVSIIRAGTLKGLKTESATLPGRRNGRRPKPFAVALILMAVLAASSGFLLLTSTGARNTLGLNGGQSEITSDGASGNDEFSGNTSGSASDPIELSEYGMIPVGKNPLIAFNGGTLVLVDDSSVRELDPRTLETQLEARWSSEQLRDIAVFENDVWVVAKSLQVQQNDSPAHTGVFRIRLSAGGIDVEWVRDSEKAIALGTVGDTLYAVLEGTQNPLRKVNTSEMELEMVRASQRVLDFDGESQVIALARGEDVADSDSGDSPVILQASEIGELDSASGSGWGTLLQGCTNVESTDSWYVPFHPGKTDLYFYEPGSTIEVGHVGGESLGGRQSVLWVAEGPASTAIILYARPQGGASVYEYRLAD